MLQENVYQIDAKITTLADKLGIERQQLWSAIVHQAKVEAWTDVGLALVGLVMVVAGIVVMRKAANYGAKNKNRWDEWAALGIVGTVLSAVSFVAGTIIFLVNAYNAALIFPNPVYYAYMHLIY